MFRKRLLSPLLLLGAALWAASLALYIFTLAPTLTWGLDEIGVDGGELLAAASTLGIPHPPGYPTYTLLLWVFAKAVPIGDFAHRGNLFSAVLASGSVAMLYWATLRFVRFTRPEGPRLLWAGSAALGAAAFATSPMLWSQATITEVYSLNAMFVASLLVIASHLALRLPGEPDRRGRYTTAGLAAFGLLLGLGLGNHLTLLAVAVPLLFWIWSAIGWRKMASPWALGALLLGLGVYLNLPIRAAQSPPVNWGSADTLAGFAWMLSGRVYQDYVFGVPAGSLLINSVEWLELVFSQFNPLGLFFGLMAIVPLSRRDPRFLAATLASMAILSVYSITYHTLDSEVLTIPAWVLFALWVGIGFSWTIPSVAEMVEAALTRLKPLQAAGTRAASLSILPLLTLAAFFALPGSAVILNYGSQDLSRDTGAYDHASDIFDRVPDGSLVLSTGEQSTFSLWYMRFVERTDRDIAPVSVELLQFDWYWRDVHARYPDRIPREPPSDLTRSLRLIAEHVDGEAGIFFTFWHPSLETDFELTPLGSIYRAKLKPLP